MRLLYCNLREPQNTAMRQNKRMFWQIGRASMAVKDGKKKWNWVVRELSNCMILIEQNPSLLQGG